MRGSMRRERRAYAPGHRRLTRHVPPYRRPRQAFFNPAGGRPAERAPEAQPTSFNVIAVAAASSFRSLGVAMADFSSRYVCA
ncbi:hypothetical protein KH5H1_61260 [Corallococcus caeni]|uniref:Uncharacterized protein n=1 Tax=Corallococcus caeni TaxID=3082388 RepID=A0ABQ6R3H5_9BACT|nr:hypothetical protein KH5H1_61260 [Corallococcus sp. KH5-1]GMU10456.1 hypothetical protein ASNO1_67100 [Corallococcus sp. NO1]